LIVNKQIKDELDVYAQEVSLASAKRINGLRAVFGEVSFLFQFSVLPLDHSQKHWIGITLLVLAAVCTNVRCDQ
jgi:alanyl-tRNA synthetase